MSKRVLVLVEGQTEANFIQELLVPHLELKSVYLQKPIVIPTKIIPGQPYYKGGVIKYAPIKERLQKLFKDNAVDAITMMFDYYRFPSDFFGWGTLPDGDCYQRVEHLEKALKADNTDQRFIPYLSLHEFEGLLFSDTTAIAAEFQNRKASELAKIRVGFASPEEINDGSSTAPSKRLSNLFSEYQKPLHGLSIARRITLAHIRKACQHFNTWLNTLERLAQS